jgi:hypothetical protein
MHRIVSVAVLIAVMGCSSTPGAQFHLELSSSGTSASTGGSVKVQMRAGEIRTVQLLVVGSVPSSITFGANELPEFATLQGPMLTLSPGRADAGEYTITLTATSDGESQSAVLDVVVDRFNNAPTWTPPTLAFFGDDKGSPNSVRLWTCPGPTTCTADGTPHVLLTACDADGDTMTFDVEIVLRGQTFSKVPTHSASMKPPSPYSSDPICVNLSLSLGGLERERSYDFAVRVSDEFGAIARVVGSVDGWVHRPEWGFDQGPCATRQCACKPSGTSFCTTGIDCCSGRCNYVLPPSIPSCE